MATLSFWRGSERQMSSSQALPVFSPALPMGVRATVHGGGQAAAALGVRHASKIPKVPSLVFDLELEESSRTLRPVEECNGAAVGDVAQQVAAAMQPRSSADQQLRIDVDDVLAGCGAAADISELAKQLSVMGYRAVVRTALGGGFGNACLTNLRHTFLVCTTPGSPVRGAVRFIVDPRFRESFEIAKPTERYAAALAAVPAVFTGTEERLCGAVALLCAELRDAFAACGAVVPPWRKAESMLSKWLPRRSVDASVSGGGMLGTVMPIGSPSGSNSSGGGWSSGGVSPASRRGGLSACLGAPLPAQRHVCVDGAFLPVAGFRDVAAVSALQC